MMRLRVFHVAPETASMTSWMECFFGDFSLRT